MLFKLKLNTTNDKIKRVLNENYISVEIAEESKAFEYDDRKIITVKFKHNHNLVSQAFYLNDEFTWVPFDGIKVDVDEENRLYTLFDTDNFDGIFPDEQVMAVSYILGGGIWSTGYSEYSKKLDVIGRISQLSLQPVHVPRNHILKVNHFINYSVSYNYINKEKERRSAFDFSKKMETPCQLEYTPRRVKGLDKKGYEEIYKKIDKSVVDFRKPGQGYMCTIL